MQPLPCLRLNKKKVDVPHFWKTVINHYLRSFSRINMSAFFLSAVSEAVGNLSCSGISWNSIQLSWDPPVNPNGQILFYEIVMEVDSYRVNTAEYTVTGLLPGQEYTLSVTAINSAGHGEQINCTASTLSESGTYTMNVILSENRKTKRV